MRQYMMIVLAISSFLFQSSIAHAQASEAPSFMTSLMQSNDICGGLARGLRWQNNRPINVEVLQRMLKALPEGVTAEPQSAVDDILALVPAPNIFYSCKTVQGRAGAVNITLTYSLTANTAKSTMISISVAQ